MRIVAATNRHLSQLVKEKLFRSDLYFRLKVVKLAIPPLRERCEDIDELASFFLAKWAPLTRKTVPVLTPAALAALRGHNWPGNVRELENVMRAALVLGKDPIDVGHLDLGTADGGASPDGDASLTAFLETRERELVLRTLDELGGNVAATAKKLGIGRSSTLRQDQGLAALTVSLPGRGSPVFRTLEGAREPALPLAPRATVQAPGLPGASAPA